MIIGMKDDALTKCKLRKRFGRTHDFRGIRFFVLLTSILLIIFQTSYVSSQGVLRQRSVDKDRQNAKNSDSVQSASNFAAVPWDSLDDSSRKRIQEVIRDKTIYRRMPRQVGYCDPEMYDFLINHPDVVIELWNLLGVTHITLKETGPNEYHLTEGTTTTSQVEVVHKSENLCIAYALGEYDAPMLRRKIKGDVVLFLRSRYGRDKEGRPIVQSDLDAYVRIHNPGAEMLAKMLVPVVGKIADSNFEQTLDFVRSVSAAAQEDYETIQDFAGRLQNVRPETADEFARMAETVYDREIDRYVRQMTASQKTTDELVRRSSSPNPEPETAISPKYALRADIELETQQQMFSRIDEDADISRPSGFANAANDKSSLMVSTPLPDDFESRFIPYPDDEPVEIVTGDGLILTSPDVLMRSLREPVETNRRATESRVGSRPGTSRQDVAPLPPQRLTILRDDRTIDDTRVVEPPAIKAPRVVAPVPVLTERSGKTAPTVGGSLRETSSQATEISTGDQTPSNNRVIINAITPGQSSVGASYGNNRREAVVSPWTSTTVPSSQPSPSPSRFGTSTPVVPPAPVTSSRLRTENGVAPKVP